MMKKIIFIIALIFTFSSIFFVNVYADDCVHDLEKVDQVDPTCRNKGVQEYYKCKKCDKYFIDAAGLNEIKDFYVWRVSEGGIARIPHSLTKIDQVDATCIGDGVKEYYYCSRCEMYYDGPNGKYHISNLEQWKTDAGKIGKIEHNIIKVETIYPTCISEGVIWHYHCTLCENEFKDSEGKYLIENFEEKYKIGIIGHSMMENIQENPTCEKDGQKHFYTCFVCGEVFSDIDGKNKIEDFESWKAGEGKIEKLGHGLEKIEEVQATKKSNGLHEYYHCEVCDKYFEDIESKNQIINLDSWKSNEGVIIYQKEEPKPFLWIIPVVALAAIGVITFLVFRKRKK